MQTISKPLWMPENYCFAVHADSATANAQALAYDVYARVCRTDFDNPGFCSISLSAINGAMFG